MIDFCPKVSIVIPVYNGADFLHEAIDSALSQTYKNIEILVINDGSNDNKKTENIALAYGNKIKYLKKKNGGVASALNLGIEKMTGEYFSWLSHDDVYLDNKIETQIDFIREKKLIKQNLILYSDYFIANSKMKIIHEKRISEIPHDKMFIFLITSYPINGCTTLINRDIFESSGHFNESLKTSQDYDLWFRLSLKYPFFHIPQALLKSRTHDKQGSRTMPEMKKEGYRYYMNCFNQIENTKKLKENFIDYLGKHAYKKLALNLAERNYLEPAKYALSQFLKTDISKFSKTLAKYQFIALLMKKKIERIIHLLRF